MKTKSFLGRNWSSQLNELTPLTSRMANASDAMSYLLWDRRAGFWAVFLLVVTVGVVWLMNRPQPSTAVGRVGQTHPDQQWRLAP